VSLLVVFVFQSLKSGNEMNRGNEGLLLSENDHNKTKKKFCQVRLDLGSGPKAVWRTWKNLSLLSVPFFFFRVGWRKKCSSNRNKKGSRKL
jgi:hypothetical protein